MAAHVLTEVLPEVGCEFRCMDWGFRGWFQASKLGARKRNPRARNKTHGIIPHSIPVQMALSMLFALSLVGASGALQRGILFMGTLHRGTPHLVDCSCTCHFTYFSLFIKEHCIDDSQLVHAVATVESCAGFIILTSTSPSGSKATWLQAISQNVGWPGEYGMALMAWLWVTWRLMSLVDVLVCDM